MVLFRDGDASQSLLLTLKKVFWHIIFCNKILSTFCVSNDSFRLMLLLVWPESRILTLVLKRPGSCCKGVSSFRENTICPFEILASYEGVCWHLVELNEINGLSVYVCMYVCVCATFWRQLSCFCSGIDEDTPPPHFTVLCGVIVLEEFTKVPDDSFWCNIAIKDKNKMFCCISVIIWCKCAWLSLGTGGIAKCQVKCGDVAALLLMCVT